ncbi:MAG: hypothetical protein ACN6I4_01820 [bacterium]
MMLLFLSSCLHKESKEINNVNKRSIANDNEIQYSFDFISFTIDSTVWEEVLLNEGDKILAFKYVNKYNNKEEKQFTPNFVLSLVESSVHETVKLYVDGIKKNMKFMR